MKYSNVMKNVANSNDVTRNRYGHVLIEVTYSRPPAIGWGNCFDKSPVSGLRF